MQVLVDANNPPLRGTPASGGFFTNYRGAALIKPLTKPTASPLSVQSQALGLDKLAKRMFRAGWDKYEARFSMLTPQDTVQRHGKTVTLFQAARIDAKDYFSTYTRLPAANPSGWDKPKTTWRQEMKRIVFLDQAVVSVTIDGKLKNEGNNWLEVFIIRDRRDIESNSVILIPGDVSPPLPDDAKAFMLGLAGDSGSTPQHFNEWPYRSGDDYYLFEEGVASTPIILL